MNSQTIEPRDMRWLDKGVFGIEWSDGHQGVYPVRYLRQNCPCAACVDEWTGERRVQPDSIPLLVMLEDIQPVGRYALQFIWKDGHNTGIYTFDLLRRLCQCEVCHPKTDTKAKSSSRQLL